MKPTPVFIKVHFSINDVLCIFPVGRFCVYDTADKVIIKVFAMLLLIKPQSYVIVEVVNVGASELIIPTEKGTMPGAPGYTPRDCACFGLSW